MKPRKLSDEDVQNTLKRAVQDAVGYVEANIAPKRARAARYFDGYTSLKSEDGRSKAVATKCRDTVRALMPVLMRIFLQSGKAVEFEPARQETVDAAEQATAYCNYIFRRNGGFMALYDVFFDALVKKVGIVKPYFEETSDVEFDEYGGLTEEEAMFIAADPEIEVLESEPGEDGLWSMKASRTDTSGRIRFDVIPPEDFFIDADATSISDCRVCGHSTEGVVGDLVQMGFDFAEVYELSGVDTDSEEEIERSQGATADEDDANDPSMRPVLITEAYMRMDIEGTGIPKRYKFICGGKDYKVLDWELCDHEPYSAFEVDPEPHTFFGRSIVELIEQDQDVATSLLRGLIDNVHLTNNPRLSVNVERTNGEDLLNNEIGGIIRTKGDPAGAIMPITIGNGGSITLPAIQHFDQMIRGKTGVSNVSMGLNADALSQHETATGVDAAVAAEGAVAELIARILAEGGMCALFKTIAALARAHPQRDDMMRVDGRFVPVDPRSWGADMDVVANVGLGTNQQAEKIATLQFTLQAQQQIWGTYGPSNGIVTLTGIRNTLADIQKMGGIHNADRYFLPMDDQREAMLMEQAAQAAQGQEGADPNMALVQVEAQKAQMKAQADMAEGQRKSTKDMLDARQKAAEAAARDDRERDKMAQDLMLKAAEIQGRHGLAVDQNAIKREQQMPRPPQV